MPYYFYDVYNVNTIYKYSVGSFTASSFSIKYMDRVYSGYKFDTTTGLFSITGYSFGRLGYEDAYKTGYQVSSDGKTVYYASYNRTTDQVTVTRAVSVQSIASQTKGTLRSSDQILESTYPANGILNDRWYVRKTALKALPIPVILTGDGQTTTKLKSDKDQLKIVWSLVIEPNQLTPQYLIQCKTTNELWSNLSIYNGAGLTQRIITLSALVLDQLNQPLEVRVAFSNGYETSYSESVFIIIEKDKQAIQKNGQTFIINSNLQWQEVSSFDEADDTLITKIARQNKEIQLPTILKEGWDNMAVFSQKINLKKYKDLIKIKITPIQQPPTA